MTTAIPHTLVGSGTPSDEEVARLKRELAPVRKERYFLREAAAFFAKDRPEVSGDPTLLKDQAELMSFYDFPTQHWQSLRQQPDRIELRDDPSPGQALKVLASRGITKQYHLLQPKRP